MLTPFFQFSFLCVVASANLCLGFAIASRLGFGPPLAVLFQLESIAPALLPAASDCETTVDATEQPVADKEPAADAGVAIDDESTAADQPVGDARVPSGDEPVNDLPEA